MNSVVIGFAGGGGVEAGLIGAGINPTLSVEFDPSKPKLSSAIAEVHKKNFKHQLKQVTVQNWGIMGFPSSDRCQYAHFSPVCCNFSTEKNASASENDISSAVAIADFISQVQPTVFTLENVPAYRKSWLWTQVIQRSLLDNGYVPNDQIVNFAEYGVPQNRKRFFGVAIKNSFFSFPPQSKQISWWEATSDLLPTLEETTLTEKQEQAVKAIAQSIREWEKELPFLIPRVGYGFKELPRITPWHKPAPTIKRSIFDDGKGAGRNQVWTIWDGNKAYNCNIEVFRRLQTFPGWYRFSEKIRIDGSIIGNSVPPLFITKIYTQIKQILEKKGKY